MSKYQLAYAISLALCAALDAELEAKCPMPRNATAENMQVWQAEYKSHYERLGLAAEYSKRERAAEALVDWFFGDVCVTHRGKNLFEDDLIKLYSMRHSNNSAWESLVALAMKYESP